jgi:hypothetical protein
MIDFFLCNVEKTLAKSSSAVINKAAQAAPHP